MKVTTAESFTPITLTITLETLEEAQDFYNLHNHTDVIDCTPALDHDAIRNALIALHGKTVYDIFDTFANNLADKLKDK